MRTLAMLAIVGSFAVAGSASASVVTYTTIDNPADPTFNQLLGINNAGTIVGYYGSGALPAHPNTPYVIKPPYTTFARYSVVVTSPNPPPATEMQFTGINTAGNISGFLSATGTDATGFLAHGPGKIGDGGLGYLATAITDPKGAAAAPPAGQLLGLNDHGFSVGFYTDAAGLTHGFAFHYGAASAPVFTPLAEGVKGDQATAINNSMMICGFFIDNKAAVHGYVRDINGDVTIRYTHNDDATQFFGINNANIVVGGFTDGKGKTHGLLFNPKTGHAITINAPNGVGGTTLNGINDMGQAVGFYTDAAGNTHGLLLNGVPKTF